MASSESQLPGLPGFDAENIQPWTVEVVVCMTILALSSVGLRLYSRHLKAQTLWWDDYIIIFSMILTLQVWNLLVVGFIFAMHACGMGLHADKVEPANIVMMAKWLVVAEVLYAWNLGWTKLSLLVMYYRIFRVPYFKKMAWVVGTFVFAWVICITFLFIFICVPVEKLWYPDVPGHCINQVGTWIANAASTIFTDVVILMLPLPPIWKLQLGKSEKIGLSAAFALGFFVVFASAYRTSVLFTYAVTDPTYTLAPTVGWTEIEMSAGIVSANLPTMLPVLRIIARFTGLHSLAETVRGTTLRSKGERSAQGLASREDTNAGRISDSSTGSRGNTFYRLPDETDSDGLVKGAAYRDPSLPVDAKLRPDMKGHELTVQTYRSTAERGYDSGNDMLLQGIRVHTKFEQTTTRNNERQRFRPGYRSLCHDLIGAPGQIASAFLFAVHSFQAARSCYTSPCALHSTAAQWAPREAPDWPPPPLPPLAFVQRILLHRHVTIGALPPKLPAPPPPIYRRTDLARSFSTPDLRKRY
ncbi:hypothetical protein FZEAL_8213 [Fusarium zealandicum]|uniref:Rhodopsin domain-containing protein n=1 Tax=Fusarium zealandicum TaxID=1053134 RepID=A0A8H4UEL7_9HYPO|nr:hypothetical protein FZEAL_8213 [Fusarium zealandicum]